MPRVVFTSNLQRHVNCAQAEVAAGTLRSVLAQVFDVQPQARGYVLDDQGHLRQHVTVFIDGRRVRDRERLDEPVGASSEVYVMQALTGG